MGVYYELLGKPETAHVKLVLIADNKGVELKRMNKNVVLASGIIGILAPNRLSFEAVEELL